MNIVYIGIGANLVPQGYDSLFEGLEAAVKMLDSEALCLVSRSNWYVSTPVPVSDQPDFLNAVLKFTTSLSASEVLDRLHQTEQEFGRTRSVRNAARVLDLDILGFNDDIIETEALSVPHPRMAQRQFVIFPFAELAPDWRHPLSGQTMAELKSQLVSTADGSQNCYPR